MPFSQIPPVGDEEPILFLNELFVICFLFFLSFFSVFPSKIVWGVSSHWIWVFPFLWAS